MRNAVFVSCAAALAAAGAVHAAPFVPGNVVVYRVGTGTGSLVNTGNAVFIDEFTPAGTLVQSVALNASAAGTKLIASGTATSEGLLSVSPNGRYVTVTGYNTTVGGSNLSNTTGAAVGRSVAVIDAVTGDTVYSSFSDFASSNNPRSAVTDDGSNLWLTGGAGGIRYATSGSSTSTQISTTLTNIRQAGIFDGQLYVSTGSGSAVRIGAVGSGTPATSGQTITNLAGVPTSGSPYAFFFADLSAGVAGVDTLYVADDAAGILKYSLVAGSWASNGAIGLGADAYRGLTGSLDAATGSVTLFSTRKGGSAAAGGGELVSLVDTAGYNAAPSIGSSLTLLSTAGANTAFRGVGLIVPTPGAAALIAVGGLAAVRRRRK